MLTPETWICTVQAAIRCDGDGGAGSGGASGDTGGGNAAGPGGQGGPGDPGASPGSGVGADASASADAGSSAGAGGGGTSSGTNSGVGMGVGAMSETAADAAANPGNPDTGATAAPSSPGTGVSPSPEAVQAAFNNANVVGLSNPAVANAIGKSNSVAAVDQTANPTTLGQRALAFVIDKALPFAMPPLSIPMAISNLAAQVTGHNTLGQAIADPTSPNNAPNAPAGPTVGAQTGTGPDAVTSELLRASGLLGSPSSNIFAPTPAASTPTPTPPVTAPGPSFSVGQSRAPSVARPIRHGGPSLVASGMRSRVF